MAEPKRMHKRRSFYLVSILVVAVITTGILIWRHYKYRMVNNKLDNLVTAKSEGLYRISYKNLVINEALGSISANDIDMQPDSVVLEKLEAEHKQPENLFFIHIPKLAVTGVKTPKAVLNKEISAHKIELKDAVIEIMLGSQAGNKKDSKMPASAELYQQLLSKLKSITTDSLVLENTSLTILDRKSKKLRGKLEGLDIRLSGIEIDSLKQYDSSQILFSKDLAMHVNHVELPLTKEEYNLQITNMEFDSRKGLFHTGEIRLKTSMSEKEFAASHSFAIDRIDLRMISVELRGISRTGLIRQQLVSDSLDLEGLSLHIFRDKSVPHDSVNRTHDYPQEAIMRLPVPLYVKKIRIRDSYIEYKEKNDKSDSSGKVSFFHVQASIDQVTNMPEYIVQSNQMVVHFKADFLNAAPFTARINLRLNDRRGLFTLDASLGAMDAHALNDLLKPMALAELDKGKINGLEYHLDATNTHGRGKLLFHYENISVRLLKKDNDKNKYKTKVLPTLAAGLLVKDSNPQHGKTRMADVNYTRDIHRSIFNLMWKSLFAAVKEVAM